MKPEAGLSLPFHGPRDTSRIIRDRIETLSQEVASGLTSDPGRALKSDFSDVSRLSHQLRNLDAFHESIAVATSWGAAIQVSLAQIGEASARLGNQLGSSLSVVGDTDFGIASGFAEGVARDIGNALGRTFAGRALFGNGSALDVTPSAEAVLADIAAIAGTATDFDSYVAAVDGYFADGGPFETTHLGALPVGSTEFPVDDGETARFDLDAGNIEIRSAFKQAVLVAGLAHAGFQLSGEARSDAVVELKRRSAGVTSDLPLLQGRIGAVEERLGILAERTMIARQDSEIALSDRLSVDPYDAATRLQNELSRLESLYAITARRSRLRLTDYL